MNGEEVVGLVDCKVWWSQQIVGFLGLEEGAVAGNDEVLRVWPWEWVTK